MQDSPQDLAVDPSSPDANVEDSFFKQGVDAEVHARFEAQPVDDWSKRTRKLRMAATGSITGVGLLAIGLLIWGGPNEGPTSVAVVSPASAAPPAPAAPVPAVAPAAVAAPVPVAAVPVETPPPAAAPAPTPVAAVADDSAALEQSCRDAFGRKKYKDVLDSCGRAFEARPTADVAVLVAETELDRGRSASALSWARKAVAADPAVADAYVFIGTAEQQAGHAQAAKAAYLKYLELAPTGRYAQDLKAIVGGR